MQQCLFGAKPTPMVSDGSLDSRPQGFHSSVVAAASFVVRFLLTALPEVVKASKGSDSAKFAHRMVSRPNRG